MRAGVRLGGGLWVSGGAALVLPLMALRMFELSALALLMLVSTVVICGVAIGFAMWTPGRSARRGLALQALAASVTPSLVRIEHGRSDPPVWGVYLVGRQVHTGLHPKRLEGLARLYPNRADLACVALMPDAHHASAAARLLRRHSFSATEFAALFPLAPDVRGRGDPSVRSVSPPRVGAVAGTAAPHANPKPQKEEVKMNSQRDLTQYEFDGQVLGKGRLVWAVVRRYVADHPGMSFDELRKVFPDELQAASELQFSPVRVVVTRLQEIPTSEAKRFHVAPGETIVVRDAEVAVSREWNVKNLQFFLERARQLGYGIVVAS